MKICRKKKHAYSKENKTCPECKRVSNRNWRLKNIDEENIRTKIWRSKNKNKQKIAVNNWVQSNKERYKNKAKEWRANNKDKNNAKQARRRAAKLQRTPKWLTKQHLEEIREFYIIAKSISWLSEESLEVDHILPLQGKHISGLHVPWNLQILPKSMNIKKGNNYEFKNGK